VLIGTGASSISRFPGGYAQNATGTGDYAGIIAKGQLATKRGHIMSSDDALRADLIEDLMCRFGFQFRPSGRAHQIAHQLHAAFPEVTQMSDDALTLTEPALARMLAMAVDAYQTGTDRHSLAI